MGPLSYAFRGISDLLLSIDLYEVRLRKDHRGVDLISDALPFGRLSYGEPNAISNTIGYTKFFSRSQDAVIRVYDEAGNVVETHEHAGQFAWLRLMAPFMAIARLVIASVCTCVISAAGIHAVAEITFALLMTVLYVGTIARPIGREHYSDAKDTTCE
jgi:hypothetical protein